MDATGCDEHDEAFATSMNGELTVCPVEGLETVRPTDAAGVTGAVALVETVMATSVTHTAPLLPQVLTCNVCVPTAA